MPSSNGLSAWMYGNPDMFVQYQFQFHFYLLIIELRNSLNLIEMVFVSWKTRLTHSDVCWTSSNHKFTSIAIKSLWMRFYWLTYGVIKWKKENSKVSIRNANRWYGDELKIICKPKLNLIHFHRDLRLQYFFMCSTTPTQRIMLNKTKQIFCQ